jgi:RHS repeat-associated protein
VHLEPGRPGEYNDLDDGGVSTVYDYTNKAPYRLKTVTRPAADDTGFPRLQESYTYDGASTFNGLDVEMYGNEKLSGLPDDERIWNDLDQDWDTGKPGGVTGDANTWSLRLSGLADTTGMSGKKVKFRVYSDDGVRLTVEGATILDCFADNNPDETVANCGKGDTSKVVWGADASIQIEYADQTNDAALDVKWDQGNGTWQTIPAWALSPDLGIVTDTTHSRVQSGGAVVGLSTETWTYPTDDLKFRHLHQEHTREDLVSGTTYTEEFTYDTTYGRVLTEKKAAGTAKEATTTFTYHDGVAPVGWGLPAAAVVSCMKKATDELGFVTDYQCDRSGNQIKQIRTVRAVAGTDQAAQTRTTITTYDVMGRATIVEQDETDQKTTTAYDKAGRVLTTTIAINASTNALTTNTYDHAGHLMTETLPDPDGAGGVSSPVVSHQWNWADLETKKVDARGKQWTTTYDAMSRAKTATSPLGAVTTSTYQLDSSLNRVVVDAPSGASTTTNYDVLGRTTSEQLENFNEATFDYDVLGNQTKMTDPAGVETTNTYSNLSELLTTEQFTNGTAAQIATTTNTYDVAGRLKEVDGPLVSADDRIEYAYDKLGRLTSSTYLGVYLPGTSTPVSAAVTYNDVGEQIKVTQALTTSTTMNRYYSYDQAGRQTGYRDGGSTSLDPNFTTTTAYNFAGWVTQVSDPRPQTIYFGYDNLGRQVCRHTATCTGTTSAAETWIYDAAGNVTQAKSPAVTYNMTYDNDGRLATVARGSTTETTYTYAASTATLSSVADAAGTTAFTYNAAGQISTVNDPLVTGTPVTTYSYDGTGSGETNTGRLIRRVDGQANLDWNRTYESWSGRLDTQTIQADSSNTTIASFDLGYNKASSIDQKAASVFSNASNGTTTYAYDGASRLIQAVGPNSTGTATTYDYAYDGAGNRTLAKETTGTVVSNETTVYNAQGVPASTSNATTGETATLTHDKIGNLTGVDSSVGTKDWSYSYDPYSRTTCAKQATTCTGTTAVTFSYDALDRAFARSYNSATTSYTYSGITETLAKTQVGAGTPTTYVHTASGAPMAEKTGSTVSFHLRDPHGDVVGLASTGAVNQGTAAYDAYGKPLASSGTTSLLGYQGDITDPITKNVDMGTRWYGPGVARFTSRDALAGAVTSPMSLNQYGYGVMNPVTMTDRTGMYPTCDGPCEGNQQEHLIRTFSRTYGAAVQAGTAGSTYSPAPAPPPPPPPIVYTPPSFIAAREGGSYAQPTLSPTQPHEAWSFAGDDDVITSGQATAFLYEVRGKVTPHGSEWDIDLTIAGTMRTIADGADAPANRVDWGITGEGRDSSNRAFNLGSVGRCFPRTRCGPEMYPANDFRLYYHAHYAGGPPTSVTLTIGGVATFDEGSAIPLFGSSPFHDTYTIDVTYGP